MKRVTFVVLGLVVLAVFAFNSKEQYENDLVKSEQTKVKPEYQYIDYNYLKN